MARAAAAAVCKAMLTAYRKGAALQTEGVTHVEIFVCGGHFASDLDTEKAGRTRPAPP